MAVFKGALQPKLIPFRGRNALIYYNMRFSQRGGGVSPSAAYVVTPLSTIVGAVHLLCTKDKSVPYPSPSSVAVNVIGDRVFSFFQDAITSKRTYYIDSPFLFYSHFVPFRFAQFELGRELLNQAREQHCTQL